MVLASDIDGRPQIVVAVSDELVKDGIRAGDLIKPIASKVVGGGGGGRPQMAQAGGRDSSKIAARRCKPRGRTAGGNLSHIRVACVALSTRRISSYTAN